MTFALSLQKPQVQCLKRQKRKARKSGLFKQARQRPKEFLFDLGFLVSNVLTGHRIEFFDFDLLGRRLLVLGGGVEMTRACGRFQFDLVAHEVSFRPGLRSA
jgi:hypothetical protein